MSDSGGVLISPAGRPNLRIDPVPPRDSVPGGGGTLLAPDRIAITMPTAESAEEWRHDDDDRKLAQAPAGDLKRLRKEADRLERAEAAVATAERSHARARDVLIAQRTFGRPAQRFEDDLARAETAMAKTKRELGITREVHERLRAQIIEQVRQDLGAAARTKLAQAHQLYDDCLGRLGQTSALLDAMRTARQAETIAAQELASAVGVTPALVNGKRPDSATGSAYRTIPTEDLDRVALFVDQKPDPIRLEGGAIAGYLARRSGPDSA